MPFIAIEECRKGFFVNGVAETLEFLSYYMD
jgi:hypothetical protein